MCRKFHYFSFLVVVAAIVMVGLTSVSRADTISFAGVTGDGDCGVDNSYTYTCAVDTHGSVIRTVNDVAFTPVPQGGGISSHSGTGWNISTPGAYLWGNQRSTSVTGSIGDVIYDFFYSSTRKPIVITFSGLTPGQEYVASFFNNAYPTDPLSKYLGSYDLTTTTHVGTFQFDATNNPEGVVTVGYTATDTEWTATFTQVAAENGIYAVSGFTNYLVPEPGALALLATGLVGLLCYAWRKRK